MIFDCKHPASALAVKKDSSSKPLDVDFMQITHHLYCKRCNKEIDLSYAKLNGGVDAFLSRARKQA